MLPLLFLCFSSLDIIFHSFHEFFIVTGLGPSLTKEGLSQFIFIIDDLSLRKALLHYFVLCFWRSTGFLLLLFLGLLFFYSFKLFCSCLRWKESLTFNSYFFKIIFKFISHIRIFEAYICHFLIAMLPYFYLWLLLCILLWIHFKFLFWHSDVDQILFTCCTWISQKFRPTLIDSILSVFACFLVA